MIDKLSNRITKFLVRNNHNISEDKAEIIDYGLNILIYQSLLILLILALALFLGLLIYIAITLVIFAILRIFAGGAHASSRIQCAIMNFAVLFGTVILAKYLWAESYFPSIVVYIVNLLIVCFYAPGDTIERPIISPKLRRRQKTISILIIICLFISALIIWKHDKVVYNIFLVCPLLTLIILTPIGYRLFKSKHSYEDVQTSSLLSI